MSLDLLFLYPLFRFFQGFRFHFYQLSPGGDRFKKLECVKANITAWVKHTYGKDASEENIKVSTAYHLRKFTMYLANPDLIHGAEYSWQDPVALFFCTAGMTVGLSALWRRGLELQYRLSREWQHWASCFYCSGFAGYCMRRATAGGR